MLQKEEVEEVGRVRNKRRKGFIHKTHFSVEFSILKEWDFVILQENGEKGRSHFLRSLHHLPMSEDFRVSCRSR